MLDRHAFLALVLLAAPAAAQSDSTVRVRLLGTDVPREVSVEAAEGRLSVEVDGQRAGEAAAGDRVAIAQGASGVTVRVAGRSVAGQSARVLGERLRLRAGAVDREYTGALAVRAVDARLEIVNQTPLSPYVASVVASELGFDVMEAAKAQAVLARTYALRRRGAKPTYDLDDHQGSQVFRGLATITATSRHAADGTDGEVLTYSGALAEGTYFSSSGGHTADNEAVWNGVPLPYLRGVTDPFDSVAPDHTWQTTASKPQVLGAISALVGGRVTGLQIEARSRSGRVTRMRAIGGARADLTGAQFRREVNAVAGWRTIRSTKFDLSVEGDQYVFRGQGFGHGVGMSQYGAIGQARSGRDYRDILTYYFTGAMVEGGRALPEPVIAVRAPIRREEPEPDRNARLPSRYILSDPRGEATDLAESRRGEGSGGDPVPVGDPLQETAPQSTDQRQQVGDRRSGLDRRAMADRRTGERAGPGRREASAGRRVVPDRRQTESQAMETPAPETQVQPRRAAW